MGLITKKEVKQSTQPDKVSAVVHNTSKKSPHCLMNSSGVFDIMSRGMNYIASMKKKPASKSVTSLAIHEQRPESTKSYETGSELVRVNRVKDGGSAQASGLRRGDVICAINGQDVRHEKSTTIARIVRRSVTQVALDIFRARSEIPFSSRSCPSLRKKIVNTTSSYHKRPLPAIPEQSISRETNAMKTMMSSLKCHGDLAFESYLSNPENTQASTNWHPDISHIPHESTREIADIYEEIGGIPNDWSDSGAESSREMSQSRMASYDPNTSWNCERIHNVTIETNESDCHNTLDWSDSSLNSAFHNQSCRSEKLPTEEELDCLNDLMSTEAEFVHQMLEGLHVYTFPLRHHIVSAHQYHTLFQNIEQLVKLSERIVHRIAETEVELSVEKIYGEQISEMSDAYLAYLSGLPAALRMCAQLHKNIEFEEFLQYMQEHHEIMSMETFIERPVKHFLQLLATIKQLVASQGRESQENIISCLMDVIHKSTESEKRTSTTSLDSGYGNSSHDESHFMSYNNCDDHHYENVHAVNHISQQDR